MVSVGCDSRAAVDDDDDDDAEHDDTRHSKTLTNPDLS